jgi:hypothetical protein
LDDASIGGVDALDPAAAPPGARPRRARADGADVIVTGLHANDALQRAALDLGA